MDSAKEPGDSQVIQMVSLWEDAVDVDLHTCKHYAISLLIPEKLGDEIEHALNHSCL